MGVTVQDNSEVIDRILEVLESLEERRLKVGILSEAGGEMLMIANVHEYGVSIDVTDKMRRYLHNIGIHLKKSTQVINIPERSFIRAGFDENKADIKNTISVMIEKLLDGSIDVDTFYNFIGNYCVGKAKEYLTNLSSPALSQVTINNKGSSNPLIDTGHLRDSITFEII